MARTALVAVFLVANLQMAAVAQRATSAPELSASSDMPRSTPASLFDFNGTCHYRSSGPGKNVGRLVSIEHFIAYVYHVSSNGIQVAIGYDRPPNSSTSRLVKFAELTGAYSVQVGARGSKVWACESGAGVQLDMQIASDLSTETAPSGNTQFTLRFEYQADADSFLQIVLPLIEGLHGASADAGGAGHWMAVVYNDQTGKYLTVRNCLTRRDAEQSALAGLPGAGRIVYASNKRGWYSISLAPTNFLSQGNVGAIGVGFSPGQLNSAAGLATINCSDEYQRVWNGNGQTANICNSNDSYFKLED